MFLRALATLAPTNPFPTETVLIVAAIVTLIALFALALKKGYITIEVVEESPEDQQCRSIDRALKPSEQADPQENTTRYPLALRNEKIYPLMVINKKNEGET
jgi:hypothetical protein